MNYQNDTPNIIYKRRMYTFADGGTDEVSAHSILHTLAARLDLCEFVFCNILTRKPLKEA